MAENPKLGAVDAGRNEPIPTPQSALGTPPYAASIKVSQIAESDPSNKDVIDAVKKQMPLNYTDFSVIGIKEQFLDGKLYSVSFHTDAGQPFWVRVYKVNNKCEVFNSDELLLSILGERYHSRTINLLDPDLIAGYIAFLITLCIGYLILFRGETVKIPDILGNALTIILGYYFGRSSQRAN